MKAISNNRHLLRLNRLPAFDVETVGPGKRCHILTQGCSLACNGCMNRDTWARRGPNGDDGLEIDPGDLAAEILMRSPEVEGLTIAGGEPLQQSDGISELLRALRASRPSLNILMYSGYRMEEIRRMGLLDVVQMVDGLVDGRYVEELAYGPGEASPRVPRGSRNQQLHLFSQEGVNVLGNGDELISSPLRLTVADVKWARRTSSGERAVYLSGITGHCAEISAAFVSPFLVIRQPPKQES